jgi:FMN reductase (NADPH)
MITNPVIETLLDQKSVRKFSDKLPSNEVLETVVRSGQQAPCASQFYSVLLSRERAHNPWRAPFLFTICVDSFKFERIMTKRNWIMVSNDLALLLYGIQDAALMAENMVVAGRSLGLGSCFLGNTPFRADQIAEEYSLPPRVFPLVQLAMGYPAENPPSRPRYPLEYTLFESEYPELDEDVVSRAMQQMDEGYLAQDYYRKNNAKISLTSGRKETFTFENYSWTEHICRKWGQWFPDPKELLDQFEKRGFQVDRKQVK